MEGWWTTRCLWHLFWCSVWLKETISQLFDVQLLLRHQLQYFKAAVSGNDLKFPEIKQMVAWRSTFLASKRDLSYQLSWLYDSILQNQRLQRDKKTTYKLNTFMYLSSSSVKTRAEQMTMMHLLYPVCKRQAALTVHVTWMVVGLRTTGLCNRTMTSPSSFCTCLWSTPWAGGLISKRNQERKMRKRERGGTMLPTLLYLVFREFTPFLTIKLTLSPSEVELEKSDWIDQSASTKKCTLGYRGFIWEGATSSALKWPHCILY